jgi:hypothetical protein
VEVVCLRGNKAKVLRNFADYVTIFGAFLFWLILIFPALEANQIPYFVAPTGSIQLPSLPTIFNYFKETIRYMGISELWACGFLGLPLLTWSQFRSKNDLFGLAAVAAGSLMWGLGVAFFGSYQHVRQLVTVGLLLILLCCVGLSGWATGLEWLVGQVHLPVIRRYSSQISILALLAVVLLAGFPNLRRSIDTAFDRTLPDRRNDLAMWADTTLAPAPYVGTLEFHKVFNAPWGGYAGQNEFPLVAISTITDRPIEEWRELGAIYAIEPYWHYLRMQETPQGQAYLEQMTVLKIYTSSDAYRDPGIVVFRLYPIQHPAEGSLGPIDLVGYDIDRAEVVPGESITFVLYWRALQPTDVAYSVYNHLTPLDTHDIVAQVDSPPLPGERRPTTTWSDPDETFVSRPFTLMIGEDVPPGGYRLLTGFYRLDTGERLLAPDGEDYLVVTTITVTE